MNSTIKFLVDFQQTKFGSGETACWLNWSHLTEWYCVDGGCRHQSKFRRLVQDESVKSKAAYRTMGPAKVQTKPPDQFLKKHEKDPKMPQSKLFISLFIFILFVTRFEFWLGS